MLNAVVKNNSGTDVKNAIIAFAAWDKNKLPVEIVGQFDFNGGYYIQEVDLGNVNATDGETFGEKVGFALDDSERKIEIIKAIVVEYTDYDGNTWENPYYDQWQAVYGEKRLKD